MYRRIEVEVATIESRYDYYLHSKAPTDLGCISHIGTHRIESTSFFVPFNFSAAAASQSTDGRRSPQGRTWTRATIKEKPILALPEPDRRDGGSRLTDGSADDSTAILHTSCSHDDRRCNPGLQCIGRMTALRNTPRVGRMMRDLGSDLGSGRSAKERDGT